MQFRGNLPPRVSSPALFTIAASNYLAHACVLGASVMAHHGVPLIVFLLDDQPNEIPLPECVEIIPARHVFNQFEWNHRRCFYSILEFATSIKPACFRHLFNQGEERVLYIDPDIRLYQRVDQFWEVESGSADLVLTPHLLSPLPEDGGLPDDLVILRAGIYNLGFAAMQDSVCTRELLQWWDNKLRTLCLEDVHAGVFTDQKWMDYAPLLVPNCMSLRHPGYNAAYWNLHERTPRFRDGKWIVEDLSGSFHDLVFFHFSGFNPDCKQLSRHETRFGWNIPGDGQALFTAYGESLVAAGIDRFRAIGPPTVRFEDGTVWDRACRVVYRSAFDQRIDLGDPLTNSRFIEWAATTAPGDHVTRYTRAVLRVRPDLAEVFADGQDAAGLMAWMRTSGLRELELDRRLVERLGPASKRQRLNANYIGYLRSHLGVGEAARNSVAALDAAGVQVYGHDISSEAGAPTGNYEIPATPWPSGNAAATIFGCNADMLPSVLSKLPMSMLTSYRIGCWYWETPAFPDAWDDRFDLVDEIWAGTQFVADAIRAKTRLPVLVMPPMVMPPPMPRDRAWLHALVPALQADEFTFLFQFDVASVPYRKNPEGVIDAFAKAFQPHEPVRLIVKALNGNAAPELMALLQETAQRRRVSFLTEALESTQRFRLLASVDSFVSLHRSEGFGLSIAEAMAYGVPVVATNWSGNVDFTSSSNAAVVAFDLVRSTVAHGPYPAGTVWAEPRGQVAAQLMRRLWMDRAWREQIALAGRETIAAVLSPQVVGSAMQKRLEQVSRFRRGHPAPHAARLDDVSDAKAAFKPTPLAVRMMRDACDYPGFYLCRLHRIPWLLWRLGVDGTLHRAEVVVSSKQLKAGAKQASSVWGRLRQRFLRWRVDARRRG